jgi:hypothetical protein
LFARRRSDGTDCKKTYSDSSGTLDDSRGTIDSGTDYSDCGGNGYSGSGGNGAKRALGAYGSSSGFGGGVGPPFGLGANTPQLKETSSSAEDRLFSEEDRMFPHAAGDHP